MSNNFSRSSQASKVTYTFIVSLRNHVNMPATPPRSLPILGYQHGG